MLNNKSIAVVIPALNEEIQIGKTIAAIPDFVDKVIIVDDGSTDETANIAKEHKAFVISHETNRGVGAAFKSGVNKVIRDKIDIMVNMDADGQFNPEDIKSLITPILEGNYDFVTASRFKDPSLYPKMTKVKFWGNRFMSWFISKLTRKKFYDVSCGFRAYTRETLLRLNLFGDFTYTQETFIDLVFKNMRMAEIPTKVRGQREFGKSRVASNVLKYAYRTFKIIIRTYRDYRPYKLFGFLAFISFLASVGFGMVLLIHYLQTGFFTPNKWAGFVAAYFAIQAILLLIIGFILDMFSRMRKNQEEIMYLLKQKVYDDK